MDTGDANSMVRRPVEDTGENPLMVRDLTPLAAMDHTPDDFVVNKCSPEVSTIYSLSLHLYFIFTFIFPHRFRRGSPSPPPLHHRPE